MIANAKRLKAAGKHTAVAGIAVADQIARCPFPAVGLRELIGDPLRRRMRRHAKPPYLPPAVAMIRSPYSSRNETVGTTNKSMAAMPSA